MGFFRKCCTPNASWSEIISPGLYLLASSFDDKFSLKSGTPNQHFLSATQNSFMEAWKMCGDHAIVLKSTAIITNTLLYEIPYMQNLE